MNNAKENKFTFYSNKVNLSLLVKAVLKAHYIKV